MANDDNTGCKCDTNYMADKAGACHACKDGALTCICAVNYKGDDCATKITDDSSDGNGFV